MSNTSNKTDPHWQCIQAGLYTRMVNGFDMKLKRHDPKNWEILGWHAEDQTYRTLAITHSQRQARQVAETLAQMEDPAMTRKPQPRNSYAANTSFSY